MASREGIERSRIDDCEHRERAADGRHAHVLRRGAADDSVPARPCRCRQTVQALRRGERRRLPRRRASPRGARRATTAGRSVSNRARRTADRERRRRTVASRARGRPAASTQCVSSAVASERRPLAASARTIGGVTIDRDAERRAARERLERQSAPLPAKRSRVRAPVKVLAQPVEQRLANPIGRGPQARGPTENRPAARASGRR